MMLFLHLLTVLSKLPGIEDLAIIENAFVWREMCFYLEVNFHQLSFFNGIHIDSQRRF